MKKVAEREKQYVHSKQAYLLYRCVEFLPDPEYGTLIMKRLCRDAVNSFLLICLCCVEPLVSVDLFSLTLKAKVLAAFEDKRIKYLREYF